MASMTPIFYFCKLCSLCIWHFSTIQSVKNNESQSVKVAWYPLMVWQDTCMSGATSAATTKLREDQRKSLQRNRNILKRLKITVVCFLWNFNSNIAWRPLILFQISKWLFLHVFPHSLKVILYHTSSHKHLFLCNHRLKNNLFCC